MADMTEIEALALSAVIEGPVALFLARLTGWPSRGAWHVGLASIVATAVTHPQLWAGALWAYRRFAFWPTALVAEGLVVLVEGMLISWMAGMAPRHAMMVSLLANSASCAAGFVFIG